MVGMKTKHLHIIKVKTKAMQPFDPCVLFFYTRQTNHELTHW